MCSFPLRSNQLVATYSVVALSRIQAQYSTCRENVFVVFSRYLCIHHYLETFTKQKDGNTDGPVGDQ